MQDSHNHETEEIFEEENDLAQSSKELRAFDSESSDEAPHPGYNARTVFFDLSLSSPLSWENEKNLARQYIQQGYCIVFDIKLGIFETGSLPLRHPAQFQSLAIAIEHFRDTILIEFQEHTKGMICSRIPLRFSNIIPWDEELIDNFDAWIRERSISNDMQSIKGTDYEKTLIELYLRDMSIEYLQLLFSRIPDSIACFLLLDASDVQSPFLFLQLTAKDRYDRFILAIKNAPIPIDTLVWQSGADLGGYIGTDLSTFTPLQERADVMVGIVLPLCNTVRPQAFDGLEQALTFLIKKQIPFRIISEEHLTICWEGIDELILCSKGISKIGVRKLCGFLATGGMIIYTDKSLGYDQDTSFIDWTTMRQRLDSEERLE
jgi:hypothetical protein